MYYVLKIHIPNRDNNEVVPQVESMGPGYDWDAPESVTRLKRNAILDRAPNMNTFTLNPETRPTDLLSQGYICTRGLLASEPFCRTLDGLAIQEHQRFNAVVAHNRIAMQYCWLHFTKELEDRIDYAASDFLIDTEHAGSVKPVRLSSRKDLDEMARRLVEHGEGVMVARRIVFQSGTPTYDLFCVQLSWHTFFVSERLAHRLTARRLTGFELSSTEIDFIFSESSRAGAGE